LQGQGDADEDDEDEDQPSGAPLYFWYLLQEALWEVPVSWFFLSFFWFFFWRIAFLGFVLPLVGFAE
jgi:hypothetical protein